MTDSRCTRIITFEAEIRTGQDCGAQILLTNDGFVAKIYDPVYYHCFDGFYKKSVDPTATADHDYRNEANAYSAMMSSKVQGDIMPRYHGSWTFEITATIEGQQRSRDVRMILMDHISGIPMLDIEPEDLSCKARKNILYKVIEAKTDLRIAGLEHHDLEPRNIMVIPSSVYGSSSDDELSGIPNYETSTFENADLRVCIIDFARSCVYKLVGKQRIAAEYHNPLKNGSKRTWYADAYLLEHVATLSKEPAPQLWWNRPAKSEADVVSHSDMHLLHPVLGALESDEGFKGKIAKFQEFNIKPLRVDIALNYKCYGDSKTVLMIEFKKADLIDTCRFENALWQMSELDGSCMPLVDNHKRYLLAGETEEKLMKQAKAYARVARCLYIALCDYQSLILLKFSKDLSVVNVKVVDKNVTTFRRAMLGFLLTAIDDHDQVPAI
ncbi:hypothetical protein E8E13_007899 [Curvularia kusanoi]|uniref:Protein kinase domain-containing protein n=1 Tax=Curvularia kusanoi TaxID=90978 RepID=A0A9P4TJW0_CURKU|nr:hypothetical protein E8E13_007899 [Curvularia kusanoi]